VNDRVDTLAPYICPSQCKNIWTDRLDADTYRPKFFRVPMDLITSADNDQGSLENECLRVNILQHPVGTNSTINLEITAQRPWTGQIRLTNLYGKGVWKRSFTHPGGTQQTSLPSPSHTGMYFLEFTDNPECTRVVKVMVQ